MTEISAVKQQVTMSPYESLTGRVTADDKAKLASINQSITALYGDGKITDSELSQLNELKKKIDDLTSGMQTTPRAPFMVPSTSTKDKLENLSRSIENDLKSFSSALAAEAEAAKEAAKATGFLESLDIATALMFVQSERVARLEEQIKDQLATVSKRNEQIGKLNGVLTELNGLVGKIGGTDATTALTATAAEIKAVTDAATKAGFKIDPAITSGTTTRGDLEKLVSKVKNEIDGLSNTQQMDMLRLQSLNNKRNEAFEIMTNVMKKVSDLLSNIASKLG